MVGLGPVKNLQGPPCTQAGGEFGIVSERDAPLSSLNSCCGCVPLRLLLVSLTRCPYLGEGLVVQDLGLRIEGFQFRFYGQGLGLKV